MSYKDSQVRQEVAAEATGKMEALAWIKAKTAASLLPGDGVAGGEALQELLPALGNKRKKLLALTDKEEEDAGSDPPVVAILDEATEEADKLSCIATRTSKEQASKRMQKMLKLVQKVKEELSSGSQGSGQSPAQKALKEAEVGLKKMSQNKKVTVEQAKSTLLDAALAVKKARLELDSRK